MRTSTLPDNIGLVIALGGEPVDLVVGTDISVKFLQVTLDPYFVFRVYEKIVLRVKQPAAIAVLCPPNPAQVSTGYTPTPSTGDSGGKPPKTKPKEAS